jgi:transcriptional regulator with XRE-family HTH domain
MLGPRTIREKRRRELRHRLADGLRSERKRLGLSQERAAEKAGYSLQYFQRIEREIVNVPLDTLARLAHAFGVDPVRLLRGPAG